METRPRPPKPSRATVPRKSLSRIERSRWDSNPPTLTGAGFRDRICDRTAEHPCPPSSTPATVYGDPSLPHRRTRRHQFLLVTAQSWHNASAGVRSSNTGFAPFLHPFLHTTLHTPEVARYLTVLIEAER